MHKIKIKNRVIWVENGKKLSDVFIEQGISHEHTCGGRGVCKKCTVLVNGKEELSCEYHVESDITVELLSLEEVLSETGGVQTNKITQNLCFVLDIGTTTLALALVSLDEGKIVRVITRTNPQRVSGADVMSRIDYCSKNSVSALNSALLNELNAMLAEFNLERKLKLYISGNTTMLHLFFGVDCSGLGVAPYTPVFLESKIATGEQAGLQEVCEIISLPSVSAFVGADIVAGLNFVPQPEKDKYSLLIDLGTNAEIALFSQDSVLCTAAAAGPCFEGANISCGMSATSGAVNSFSMDKNSKKSIKTVGEVSAKGICGTGLIDIIAALLENKIIDETGYMDCEKFHISHGVYLTQEDIRQFQLAKSAVYSAILSLMKIRKIGFDDIETMYISGGFSAKINIENAAKTGLLPKELTEKCKAVNNSSLLGTVKFACENNDLSKVVSSAEYVDLSSSSYFSNLFIENMMF